MDWQQRMAIDPAVLVGKPIIKGTRIAVEFVIDLLARGWTPGQVLQEYHHLQAEDIQACLAYAGDGGQGQERGGQMGQSIGALDACGGHSRVNLKS